MHLLSIQKCSNSGDRKWWSIHSRRDESSEHSLCEGRISSSGEESEKSDEQMQVQVVASGFPLV